MKYYLLNKKYKLAFKPNFFFKYLRKHLNVGIHKLIKSINLNITKEITMKNQIKILIAKKLQVTSQVFEIKFLVTNLLIQVEVVQTKN